MHFCIICEIFFKQIFFEQIQFQTLLQGHTFSYEKNITPHLYLFVNIY